MAYLMDKVSTDHLEQLMNDIMSNCLIISSKTSECSDEIGQLLEDVNNIYVNYAHRWAVKSEIEQTLKS